MPIVTVDPTEYVKVDLKTAPPDGFVMLRPLPYAQKIKRRDKTSKMVMRAESKGGGRGKMRSQQMDTKMEFESAQEWATQHDFAYCIGEHNLQNKDGSLIDFAHPVGWSQLDPRVGDEISEAIFEMNELPDNEEEDEDFLSASVSSTSEPKSITQDSTET